MDEGSLNALGRNLSQTGPRGTASYEYDAAGRRTKLTYPGTGLFVNYDYNAAGDLTAVRENNATSGIGVLATYAYDNLGRRTSLTRGNGTSTNYGYDPVSRLAPTAHGRGGAVSDDVVKAGVRRVLSCGALANRVATEHLCPRRPPRSGRAGRRTLS